MTLKCEADPILDNPLKASHCTWNKNSKDFHTFWSLLSLLITMFLPHFLYWLLYVVQSTLVFIQLVPSNYSVLSLNNHSSSFLTHKVAPFYPTCNHFSPLFFISFIAFTVTSKYFHLITFMSASFILWEKKQRLLDSLLYSHHLAGSLVYNRYLSNIWIIWNFWQIYQYIAFWSNQKIFLCK